VVIANPSMEEVSTISRLLRGTDHPVAGAAAHGAGLLELVGRLAPWGVILDLALPDHADAPGVGWAAAAAYLHESSPNARILLIFQPRQYGAVRFALSHGASAYAEKPLLRHELVSALGRLSSGAPPMPFHGRPRRTPCTIPFRYRPAAGGAPRAGSILDLGAGGFRFSAPEEVARRAVLSVEIDLPGSGVASARGQVCRPVADAPRERGFLAFEWAPGHRERVQAWVDEAVTREAGRP
jgi:CheY-like chemotaxis protein